MQLSLPGVDSRLEKLSVSPFTRTDIHRSLDVKGGWRIARPISIVVLLRLVHLKEGELERILLSPSALLPKTRLCLRVIRVQMREQGQHRRLNIGLGGSGNRRVISRRLRCPVTRVTRRTVKIVQALPIALIVLARLEVGLLQNVVQQVLGRIVTLERRRVRREAVIELIVIALGDEIRRFFPGRLVREVQRAFERDGARLRTAEALFEGGQIVAGVKVQVGGVREQRPGLVAFWKRNTVSFSPV